MIASKRRRLSFLALAGLATLAIGVSQGIAGSHHHVTVNIAPQRATCDTNNKVKSPVGFVEFAFKPDKKLLNIKVKINALPNTTYAFYVLDGNTCTQIGGQAGSLLTKPNGKGSTSFAVSGISGHKFVLNANDGTNDNYSAIGNVG